MLSMCSNKIKEGFGQGKAMTNEGIYDGALAMTEIQEALW